MKEESQIRFGEHIENMVCEFLSDYDGDETDKILFEMKILFHAKKDENSTVVITSANVEIGRPEIN